MQHGGRSRGTNRWVTLVVACTLGALVGGFGAAGPAAAHGDEGELTVITAEPAGPLQVELQVGLLYANDEEPATEGTVSVTGTGPAGASLAATPLPRQEGAKFGATISVPVDGPWTFTFTAETPEATASADVAVEAAPVTTTTAPATTTEAPATTTAAPEAATTAAPATTDADADSSDDSSPVVPIVLALAAVAVVVGIVLYLRSRRTPEDPSGDTADGTPSTDA